MESPQILLQWSKLILFSKEEVEKLTDSIEAVFRVSKKEADGKFYVVFVGSTTDLKKELDTLLFKEHMKSGEFSFRYAPLKDEEMRKSVEKQMYKQYAPKYNIKEPESSLEVRANLI